MNFSQPCTGLISEPCSLALAPCFIAQTNNVPSSLVLTDCPFMHSTLMIHDRHSVRLQRRRSGALVAAFRRWRLTGFLERLAGDVREFYGRLEEDSSWPILQTEGLHWESITSCLCSAHPAKRLESRQLR